MIQLKHLNKNYYIHGQVFQALHDINLIVPRGEVFGILGKSGAGKSTVLRCVNLLERPSSGQVLVNDIDLTTLSRAQLRTERRKIGMIFQHFNLLESRTAFENIALPLEIIGQPKSAIQKRVDHLLDLVGLQHRKNYFPAQLSGGQKQRVAIARALATEPEVLLSDEATSALDQESTVTILNLLKKINRELGLTILLITHELDVVKRVCDYVGILDHGMLVEKGSAIDILATPKTQVTKQLVQSVLHFNLPAIDHDEIKLVEEHDKSLMLRLTFIGEDSEQALISSIVKKFDVTVNIKQAQIEQVQDTALGFTICELTGPSEALDLAFQYINATSVKVEIIQHG